MTRFEVGRRTIILGGVASSASLTIGIGNPLAQQGPGVANKEIKLGTWMP